MRITYLVNQYPKTSHAFIRREILAVEREGCEVTRHSVWTTLFLGSMRHGQAQRVYRTQACGLLGLGYLGDRLGEHLDMGLAQDAEMVRGNLAQDYRFGQAAPALVRRHR